jgi:hypothetical protein
MGQPRGHGEVAQSASHGSMERWAPQSQWGDMITPVPWHVPQPAKSGQAGHATLSVQARRRHAVHSRVHGPLPQ